MNQPARHVIFFLDSPNIRDGRALAGLPARVLGLASALGKRTPVTVVVCDHGDVPSILRSNTHRVVLVHPDDVYNHHRAVLATAGAKLGDVVVYHEPETVLRVEQVAHACGQLVLYDAHDVEGGLAAESGMDSQTVIARTQQQEAAAAAADGVVALTEADRQRICGSLDPTSSVVIPLTRNFEQSTPRSLVASRFVFLGNFYYPPNATGLHNLSQAISEAIWLGEDRHIIAVGRMPTELGLPARVVAMGPLNDLKAISKGGFGLAPGMASSGMRSKLLDYVSNGLVPIATIGDWAGWESAGELLVPFTVPATEEVFVAGARLLSEPTSTRLATDRLFAFAKYHFDPDRWAERFVDFVAGLLPRSTVSGSVALARSCAPEGLLPTWISDHSGAGGTGRPAVPVGCAVVDGQVYRLG